MGWVCVLGFGSWPTSVARADSVGLPVAAKRFSLGGELSYFGDRQDASRIDVMPLLLSAQYGLNASWSIAADWGFITAISTLDHGSNDAVWRPGNPTAYGQLRGAVGGVHYRLAAGGAAPLAVIERHNGQGRLQHVAYNDVQGMHGLWDAFLWAPSRGALLARGELEFDAAPDLRLELASAPMLMLPAREAFGRASVAVLLPFAVGASSSRGIVRLGLRLQAVVMPQNTPDLLQLSLEPWLRVALHGATFIEARYTGNLDEPLAGQRGPRIWGLHVSAGGLL
jgi:hypothetical protein